MARVIDIKCPKCSAPQPIAADAQTITCRYCGGTSVVERGGKTIVPPTPGQGVVHLPTSSPLKMMMAVRGSPRSMATTARSCGARSC